MVAEEEILFTGKQVETGAFSEVHQRQCEGSKEGVIGMRH